MTQGQADGRGYGVEPSTQTTSVALPPVSDEVIAKYRLSEEERRAVTALPQDSALLLSNEGEVKGARFLLDRDVTTVGRRPDSDIFLDDVTVSRKHAEFRREGRVFRVVDSSSLNGTYVNGDRVDEVELRSGSEVRIGKYVLKFYQPLPEQ
ncbi:FHA domain-containing protein [Pseudoglutamicibacter albus]|uniref:Signal peptide protein n=1 Tax=Pseudoglutamicibacter albus DNF00011 TaxID=1401063 RepID=A0A095ZLW4_9MICC|nr:FHA domain-containing protein [Pseudoglutamicibacter albus]KGF19602.1 signal peptide protein [Pseudoglutamicibacter albus DNF00011]